MPHLHARALEASDLPTRVAWFNTPSVYHQMMVGAPVSLEDTRQWFMKNRMNAKRRDLVFERINEEGKRRPAAMGGLVDIHALHQRAELYLLVDPDRTGRGIGQACLRWLCHYGFTQLNLSRIYLYTSAKNDRARRLYERNGFVHEGVLRQHVFQDGAFADRHVQALLQPDWKQQAWYSSALLTLDWTIEHEG